MTICKNRFYMTGVINPREWGTFHSLRIPCCLKVNLHFVYSLLIKNNTDKKRFLVSSWMKEFKMNGLKQWNKIHLNSITSSYLYFWSYLFLWYTSEIIQFGFNTHWLCIKFHFFFQHNVRNTLMLISVRLHNLMLWNAT